MNSLHLGEAPGRLDVMGGISDYSGGLVLQQALKDRTTVAFKASADGICRLESLMPGETLHAELELNSILWGGEVDYDFARRFFSQNTSLHWTSYVLGVVLVLMKEKAMPFGGGSFRIESSVPAGKGVSSSAALEMATLRSLASATDLVFTGTEAARLAQRAENLIAGAACGLMDQLTSAHGRPGSLLPILCQPDLLSEPVEVPGGIRFAGLDSGIRHAVGGSSYTDVRCAAFMGYTIIARELGVTKSEIARYRENGERSSLPFEGYLCNIPFQQFSDKFERILPDTISGSEFLSMTGPTIDLLTTIDPEKNYAVKVCTRHPVVERERVDRFIRLMDTPTSASFTEMGKLMLASHTGYSACGLGSSQTDEIVEMACEHYPSLRGGRISGGGNGGTVCLLAVGNEGAEALEDLRARLQEKYRAVLHLFI